MNSDGKKLKFELPYNGDSSLVDVILDFQERIEMVYGRAEDGYPQGRNTTKQRPISLDEIAEVNKRLRESGIDFNYVLNGTCHGNREFEREYRAKFVKFVEGLLARDIGIITLGNPFLIELVKQEVPDMKVAASILLEVDNLARLTQMAKTGIDYVCLSKTLLKNFNALRKIAQKMPRGVKPILLANDPCLQSCGYTQYHNGSLSHFTSENGAYVNYCRLHCNQDFATDPRKVISASFIRPEDLEAYAELGFDLFKLCDRKQTTPWILNVLEAYTSGSYEGNLADLMAPWSNIGGKYPFPSSISEDDIREQGFDGIRPNLRFSPKIDNKKLNGYLKVWQKSKQDGCENEDCDSCNYCFALANRAYEMDTERNDRVDKNLGVAQKAARNISEDE